MTKSIIQTVGVFSLALVNRMSENHLRFIDAKLQSVYSPLEWRWHRALKQFMKEQMNQPNQQIVHQYTLSTNDGDLSEQYALRQDGYSSNYLAITYMRSNDTQMRSDPSKVISYRDASQRIEKIFSNSKYCHPLFKGELGRFCWEMCLELQQSYEFEIDLDDEAGSFHLRGLSQNEHGSVHVWSQSALAIETRECENSIQMTGRLHAMQSPAETMQ